MVTYHVVEKFFKNLWVLSSTFAKQFSSIFSFNSYIYYLTRGFIASTRGINLLTRGFNLPTRAFSLLTRAFNLATRAFILLTRDFELVTRGFELVTRGFELITREFELVARGFELVTRVLLFHNTYIRKMLSDTTLIMLERTMYVVISAV